MKKSEGMIPPRKLSAWGQDTQANS